MTSRIARRLLPATAIAAALTLAPAGASDDVLARSRAAYAALRSYSDTGIVTVETQVPGAPLAIERHTFTTRYRNPRHFYFEFKKDASAGDERLAIWCDGGDFQSWWSATGVHEVFSGGRGVSAFTSAVFPTQGAAVQIPPVLFPAAEMHGPFVDMKDVRALGFEDAGGRRSHKIAGVVQSHFGSARPITVWIDAETLLVRKIVEGTPVEAAAGHVDRVTTTFDPRPNLTMADSEFRFAVPRS
jgi:outer membrane lipoprotein-sorting protein